MKLTEKLTAFGTGVHNCYDLKARAEKFLLALELAAEMGYEIPIEEQGRMLRAAGEDFTTWSEGQQRMAGLLWGVAHDKGLLDQ